MCTVELHDYVWKILAQCYINFTKVFSRVLLGADTRIVAV